MNTVHIFSIHDRKGGALSFDLKDILQAIEPRLGQWSWRVCDLETANGGAASALPCDQWLSSRELLHWADTAGQTIEGTFIAFPRQFAIADAPCDDWTLAAFPTSSAVLVVNAVDSSFFEVYAKDATVADLLRQRFRDVREENPNGYF